MPLCWKRSNFFDHGIYSFNDIFKNELSKIIHVIPLKYHNNTHIHFDKKYLLYALNNKKVQMKIN